MSSDKARSEEPMPSDICPHAMDTTFPRDSDGHIRDMPVKSTIEIDDERLAEIWSFLKQVNNSCFKNVLDIFFDCRRLCGRNSINLKEIEHLIIKYPCHVCHIDILKALLKVAEKYFLYKIARRPRVMKHILWNIYFNKRMLNTKIVWLSSRIFVKYKLEEIGDPENFNHRLRKVLISPLMAFETITAVYPNYHSIDEQVHIGLVKAFEGGDADLVTAIAIGIIQSTDVTDSKGTHKAWDFYDSFTRKLYEKREKKLSKNWSSKDENKFIKAISVLNKSLFKTFPDLDAKTGYLRYKQNLKTMLELVIFPKQIWHYSLMEEVYDAIATFELADVFFEFLYMRTLMILQQIKKYGADGELHHHFTPYHYRNKEHCQFINKYKNAPERTRLGSYPNGYDEWCEIWEAIRKFLCRDAVKKFDLRFLQALISVSYYNLKHYRTVSNDLIKLLRHILDRKISSRLNILNTNIAKTIFDVINRYHDACIVCDEGFYIMKQLLDLLIPTVEERSKLKDHCTIRQAVSITYVLRTDRDLYQTMYPKGFNMLTEQLQKGEEVESLFMVSQTLQTMKFSRPHVYQEKQTEVKLISCSNSLNHLANDTFNTKVFVLDDGKKIRCNTDDLVKYSEFFSSLLDGRFHEAALEEINIRDVTEFQFHFLVNFIHFEAEREQGQRLPLFKMDLQEHLDMIILCDRLSLPRLCAVLIDNLYFTPITVETLPEMFEISLVYGLEELRRCCMIVILSRDIKPAMKMKMLRIMFEKTSHREALARDVTEWLDKLRFPNSTT